MKNNKIQFVLCLVISVLCWSNVFGESEKTLTDSICGSYQIEVSAELTTLYMDIYNVTDFGQYTPDVVEWYSLDWQIDFGDSATLVYEFSPNFPPPFEMTVCADYVVDNEWCTACELLSVGDVSPCDYTLDIEVEGMFVFGSMMNTAYYPHPTDMTWILEGGGGIISNEPSLFYEFDEVGEYVICVEYIDSIFGCTGLFCETIVIDGGNITDCEAELGIEYFTQENWGAFYLYSSNPFLEIDSIGWYIDGLFVDYGIQMDYDFPADGVYTICGVAWNIVNTSTGEVCPASEVCIQVEVGTQQNDCGNFEIFPFIDGNWGVFDVFYPEIYEVAEDSIIWYVNGQFIGTGGGMDYNFTDDGVYNIYVIVPDFFNLATGETCPGQESYFTVDIIGQQNNCEAYYEWQDNGSLNNTYTVTFANVSTGNYSAVLWDFGDGNTRTYTGQESFEYIYENVGMYNACLSVWNNDTNCQDTYCEAVFVSGTPNVDCDFELEYQALNDSLFIFTLYSPSNSGGEVLWLNFETGENYGIGDSIFITLDESGVYEVCAIVEHPTDLCGFGGLVLCETITVNNSECEDTDCVFPGDTDYNMVVDNYDVLPIGLHFGEVGFDRPNATIGWYGQPAPDWQTSADSVNLKHVDTNGDGEIFFDDIDAIEQNYNRTHDGINTMRVDGAPGLHLEFDLDTIYAAPDTGTVIINANIILGTTDLPIEELYGVAFSVGYSADLVDSNSVAADYFMSSWMGDPTMILQLEKNVVNESVIDFAYSRTDHENISGFGQIGSVSFVMTDNIIGKLASETELNFPITNIRAINNFGEEIIITGSNNTVVVNLGNTTTAVENPDLSQYIKIFPNPTSNTISMTINDLQAQTAVLYNAIGQRVLARQIATTNPQIDVSHLPYGVYLLSIQTDKGMYNQKIIVE